MSWVGLLRLKSATLRHWFCEQSISEKCAVEVVKRFKDCAQLIELNIEWKQRKNRSPLITEAAHMYGWKDFDIFIGDVQYRI